MGNDNRFRAEQESAAELSMLRREVPLLRAALLDADMLLDKAQDNPPNRWAIAFMEWRQRNKSMLDREREARRKHNAEEARKRANPVIKHHRRVQGDGFSKEISKQEYEDWLAHPSPRVEVWRTVNGQKE